MRTLAVISLALCFLTLPAFAQASQPADGKQGPKQFLVGDADRTFDSSSAKETWLAIHLLPTIGSSESQAIIKEYSEKAPTIAGMRQIFVSAEPADTFRAALSALRDGDKQPIYRDANGQLAVHFSVAHPAAGPVLIVLDEARHERMRHTGKSASEHLPFATFAKRVAETSSDNEAHEANVASHLAIEGYDPVAYFVEQKAIPGDKKFESTFRGIVYRFASAANREKFNTAPTKYLPAYGGWCATAMAKGEKVEIDPMNFKIANGRLFLFYKGLFGNALNDWNKDEPGLTAKADARWRTIAPTK